MWHIAWTEGPPPSLSGAACARPRSNSTFLECLDKSGTLSLKLTFQKTRGFSNLIMCLYSFACSSATPEKRMTTHSSSHFMRASQHRFPRCGNGVASIKVNQPGKYRRSEAIVDLSSLKGGNFPLLRHRELTFETINHYVHALKFETQMILAPLFRQIHVVFSCERLSICAAPLLPSDARLMRVPRRFGLAWLYQPVRWAKMSQMIPLQHL